MEIEKELEQIDALITVDPDALAEMEIYDEEPDEDKTYTLNGKEL